MQISRQEAVSSVMQRINRAWLDGNVEALAPALDQGIMMVFPGFTGRTQGREQFLAGFRDFCENARVHDFQDHDYEADVIGDTAVVTFRYDMIYERSGERYRASGRDLWVFRDQDGRWTAVWRAMLDVREQAA
ncbi:MAG TPA: nuclear transport factor 2 family protein [Bryobacteraceae bacterium]|nr:nuclear transport factor 2 family protein [Bryobacteraceae bacterium]